jgi:hypothetical protein
MSEYPSTLTSFYVSAYNTISGDIADAPEGLTYFLARGQNVISSYSGKTWITNMTGFYLEPVSPGGLSTAEIDQLLIDLDTDLTWSGGTITFTGSNEPRSPASDAAVFSLEAQGVEVITNLPPNLFPDPDIANWTLMNLTVAGETVDASDANYSLHTWDTLVCPVTEGESYVFEFEAQNNGGTVANYATFDVTNGVFIENVTSYFSQINDTGFTKVRVNITAPAGCSEIAVSPARGNDGPDCHLLIKNCKFYAWG